MTGNLRVTPEKMINISTQFQQSDSTVQKLSQSMMEIASQLSSTWGGDAATGYYNKLKGLEGDMNKLHSMIQEHTTDLQDMAKAYQEAEAKNLETANSLKTNEIV